MAKPTVYDLETANQVFGGKNKPKCTLKRDIKQFLRVYEESQYVNRYNWYNLPDGLNGQMLERILYYKGQAMFFYLPETNKFYFLPYALDGEIDCYGQYLDVTPVVMGSTTTEDDGKEKKFIPGLIRHVIRECDLDIPVETVETGCVLLQDYTNQIGQKITPRQIINDPLLDAMSEAIPFARTSLISGSGVKGYRVNTESDAQDVYQASQGVTKAALTGEPWIPLVGTVDLQELTNGTTARHDDYMLYMQSLNNLRESGLGLGQGSLFEKKAQVLQQEMNSNNSTTQLVYLDGLKNRQRFCDIVNTIWGLGIWCDVSENVITQDRDGDGDMMDQEESQSAETGLNSSTEPMEE